MYSANTVTPWSIFCLRTFEVARSKLDRHGGLFFLFSLNLAPFCILKSTDDSVCAAVIFHEFSVILKAVVLPLLVLRIYAWMPRADIYKCVGLDRDEAWRCWTDQIHPKPRKQIEHTRDRYKIPIRKELDSDSQQCKSQYCQAERPSGCVHALSPCLVGRSRRQKTSTEPEARILVGRAYTPENHGRIYV